MNRIISRAALMTLFSLSLQAAEKVQAAALTSYSYASSPVINIKEVLQLPISHLTDGEQEAIQTHRNKVDENALRLWAKFVDTEVNLSEDDEDHDTNTNEPMDPALHKKTLSKLAKGIERSKAEKDYLQERYASLPLKMPKRQRKQDARYKPY